ncbi:alpha/beta-hydrolase [Gonapodya prolifera JEL478]|uniref:Alpha/beta-hydrolase n=1 Tax=Gonapodya prolifera (strain JEL478) TaxID=1344416 RepID=A0A139AGW8_GONPJ|nr:alpha/beta-hydrolase [Gonapodya prolifera JEL478]|eukprot:KXS15804.1 alpha/beta-hydrolase [Gonapodya prolifera JEL478]
MTAVRLKIHASSRRIPLLSLYPLAKSARNPIALPSTLHALPNRRSFSSDATDESTPIRTQVSKGLAYHMIGPPLRPNPLPTPTFLVPDPYGYVDFSRHLAHRPLYSRLAKDRTVISFDPPGAGSSTRKPMVSMDEMLSAIKETISLVGITQPIDFIGHSQGAIVALAMALQRPDMVRRLVLVSGASGFPAMSHAEGAIWNSTHPLHGEFLRRMALFYVFRRRGFESAVIKTINWSRWEGAEKPGYGAPPDHKWFKDHLGRPVTLRKFFGKVRPRTLWFARVLSQLDYSARLTDVHVPTLAVCGRLDTQCPPPCTVELVDGIPHAEGYIFEQSGHYPMVEEEEEFWKVVDGFLLAEHVDAEVAFGD